MLFSERRYQLIICGVGESFPFDRSMDNQRLHRSVIPAKAGIHKLLILLDSRFHGNDCS